MDNRPPGSLKNFLRYVQSLLKVKGWNNAHDVKTLCTYIIDLIEGALYDWYKAQPDRARAHSMYMRHYNAALSYRADLAAGRTLEELRDLMDNLATWNLTFIRDSRHSDGVQVPGDILRLLQGVEARIQRYQVPTAWDRHRIPPGQTLPRPTPQMYTPGHIVAPSSQHAFPGIGHTLTGPPSMPSPAAMNDPSRLRAHSLTARRLPPSRPTEPQPPVPTRARVSSEFHPDQDETTLAPGGLGMPPPRSAMNNPSRSRAHSLTARRLPRSRPSERQPSVPTRLRVSSEFRSSLTPGGPDMPTPLPSRQAHTAAIQQHLPAGGAQAHPSQFIPGHMQNQLSLASVGGIRSGRSSGESRRSDRTLREDAPEVYATRHYARSSFDLRHIHAPPPSASASEQYARQLQQEEDDAVDPNQPGTSAGTRMRSENDRGKDPAPGQGRYTEDAYWKRQDQNRRDDGSGGGFGGGSGGSGMAAGWAW